MFPFSHGLLSLLLSGRSQKTQFRGTLTEALPVSVSQGNILGPLFFIIRISDSRLDRPSGVNSTMFADDTTILIQVPSITYVSTQLNEVASTASTWADTNKMSLNKSKTKSLHIMTAETQHFNLLSPQCPDRWWIYWASGPCQVARHYKDSSMSSEHHIYIICCIISSRLSLLPPIKPYLNFDSA